MIEMIKKDLKQKHIFASSRGIYYIAMYNLKVRTCSHAGYLKNFSMYDKHYSSTQLMTIDKQKITTDSQQLWPKFYSILILHLI